MYVSRTRNRSDRSDRGHGYEPIPSKQKMLEINLISIPFLDPHINVLNTDTEPLLEEYDYVFEGLGNLDGQYHIGTGRDDFIRPVAHRPWRVPVMIEWAQRKIEEMAAPYLIEQVDQPTDWVSSMPVVSKPSNELTYASSSSPVSIVSTYVGCVQGVGLRHN